jgi:addiction module HigA family antidote
MEDFLKPMTLSQTALATAIDVPPCRINEIVLGKRAITADTDLRLARWGRDRLALLDSALKSGRKAYRMDATM